MSLDNSTSNSNFYAVTGGLVGAALGGAAFYSNTLPMAENVGSAVSTVTSYLGMPVTVSMVAKATVGLTGLACWAVGTIYSYSVGENLDTVPLQEKLLNRKISVAEAVVNAFVDTTKDLYGWCQKKAGIISPYNQELAVDRRIKSERVQKGIETPETRPVTAPSAPSESEVVPQIGWASHIYQEGSDVPPPYNFEGYVK